LAKNKEKLPYISDGQILERAQHGSVGMYGSYYDWASVVPHIDKFPSLDKKQVIEEIFEQRTNANLRVLIEYRDKLGLSLRELIDVFYQHKKVFQLLNNAEFIDPEYHQEIVNKYLKHPNVSYDSLWKNSKKLHNIDINKIWQKRKTDNNISRFGIRDIIDNFSDFQTEWLTEMPLGFLNRLRSNHPEVIAERADEFGKKLDREELLDTLFKKKEFYIILRNVEKLGHTKDETLANRIIDAGGDSFVIRMLDFFPRMSRQTYLRLFLHKPQEVTGRILKFDGITKDDVYKAMTTRDTSIGAYIENIIINPSLIEGITLNQEFAEKIMQGDGYVFLLRYLEKFEGINFTELAKELIAKGKITHVIRYVEKFGELDKAWLANEAIEKGGGELLVSNYHNFQGLDDCAIVQKLLQKGGDIPHRIAKHINAFSGLKQDRVLGEELWRECLRHYWDIEVMPELNDFYSPPLDQTFTFAYDLLGEQLIPDIYETIIAVKDGHVSKEDMKKLGITKTGETGINQLRQRLNSFKSKILDQEFDTTLLEESPFYQQYYKAYVRYTNSEWGEHDEQSFEQIVETHNLLKQEKRLRKLPKEYAESGEVIIAKVDREKQETFRYSEQFLSRFGTLRASMAGSLELFNQNKPLSNLVEKAEAKRKQKINDMENDLTRLSSEDAVKKWIGELEHQMEQEGDSVMKRALKKKIDTLQNEKARGFMQKNLSDAFERLRDLNLRSVRNFQSNFVVLSQFDEFHEELRQLIFYYALQKNKPYREPAKNIAHREKPQFNDVGWVINFVDHIVNEETWSKYFTDDNATKAFRKLINVNALNEEFARAQNQASSGTISMEFIPTRGLLMEFSGHIADACWASKYDSIAESFPNFSAVTMVQNKGTKHERLAGSCMLIETTSIDNTPLLVIRGLNPLENVINALSTDDFFDKFTNYARSIADKLGRKLAIVIDDHSGGSATNRPALFQLLTEKNKTLRPVRLASEEDTTFNGYDITHVTYVI